MYAKTLVGVTAALMSFSAMAVQKTITVIASVDSNVEMHMADNSPLPSAINMQYFPAIGLREQTLSTVIYSNDQTADLEMALLAEPVLRASNATTTVPLAITYNGQALSTTTPVSLKAADIFKGATTDPSVAMDLTIAQKTVAPIAASGNYTGVVSFTLVHAPQAP